MPFPSFALSITTVELFGAVPPLYVLLATFSFHVPTFGSDCALAPCANARTETTAAARVIILISPPSKDPGPDCMGMGESLRRSPANPEQKTADAEAEDADQDDDDPDEAEDVVDDVRELRQARRIFRLNDLDDDRLGLDHASNVSNASDASVRTATPLAPFGRYVFASSAHAVPATSMWPHGSPPVNSFRNIAAVIDPAGRPPVLVKSAISLFN